MDQTANPVIRSTGGGEILFELADAGAHQLTRIETDGAVIFRSSGLGVNSFADASIGEAANIVAGSLVMDGHFTQTGADDIDISTPEIDIVFTNAASSVTLENAIAGDVAITNFTSAADIDYTQTGGGALIVGGPVSAFGDIALTTDGDIRLTRLDAGGAATLNAAGSIIDVSGGGLANITAANAFLTAGGDIGSAAASVTLDASIGVLNATAGRRAVRRQPRRAAGRNRRDGGQRRRRHRHCRGERSDSDQSGGCDRRYRPRLPQRRHRQQRCAVRRRHQPQRGGRYRISSRADHAGRRGQYGQRRRDECFPARARRHGRRRRDRNRRRQS